MIKGVFVVEFGSQKQYLKTRIIIGFSGILVTFIINLLCNFALQ